MNFFQAQDRARRRTGLLVLLFSLAVLSLVVLTQLLVMVVLRLGSQTDVLLQGHSFWSSFSWITLGEIALAIVAIVGLACGFKAMQLRDGGSAVAELLGGRLLQRDSHNLDERKVLNVVEEMAIASGMPVPPVYVIEDDAINAFAAGHDTSDVAIGITRGCIRLLDRDELQGVIAHEFSHIFNGDMRINLRLIAILHGILFIGLVGRFLIENLSSRHGYSSRNNKGAGPLIFLGVGLAVIGYCGTFFGNLIKAAISRQREFLADASAVQYTRNPGGIGNALKKIGGYPLGSTMIHPRATEVSHLFFADGIRHLLSYNWFATHPPLAERIQAIEPRWNGEFTDIPLPKAGISMGIDPSSVQIINGQVRYARPTPPPAPELMAGTAVMASMNAIGAPTADHLAAARQSLDTLPDNLLQLSREIFGACAVVHALLLDSNPALRAQQQQWLAQHADKRIDALCQQITPDIEALPPSLRLTLIDLCLPSLKSLSASQHQTFMQAVMAQIRADHQVSLFEWALYSLLRHHLDKAPRQAAGHQSLAALLPNCQRLLSALALSAHDTAEAQQQAYLRSWETLGLDRCPFDATALTDMTALDKALLSLRRLQPLAKPRLLKACCAAIEHDGHYAPASVELLRAIADTLHAPIPPVVPAGQAA